MSALRPGVSSPPPAEPDVRVSSHPALHEREWCVVMVRAPLGGSPGMSGRRGRCAGSARRSGRPSPGFMAWRSGPPEAVAHDAHAGRVVEHDPLVLDAVFAVTRAATTSRTTATATASSPPKPNSPTAASLPTGKQPDPRRWVRARHRGAHQIGPRRAKPRGRPQAPDVCASLPSIARARPAACQRRPQPSGALDVLSARVLRVGRWRPARPVGPRAGGGLTH